jgi:erythromycin esterase-like protein/predicted phosphoribosyltransferase
MNTKFSNRRDAGRRLAVPLAPYAGGDDLIVLALPRGGVPVAAEIARALAHPMDVLLVRKLGVPGHEELAFGALASGGVQVRNGELSRMLGLREDEIEAVVRREKQELERREKLYRNGRPPPEVAGRSVIVVDDGAATGSSMSAAIELLRKQRAGRIIVAVPVAPADTVHRLAEEADEVVVLATPEPFGSVGEWYLDFTQTRDQEVQKFLAGELPDLTNNRVEVDEVPGGTGEVLQQLRLAAHPLTGEDDDYDDLLKMIGDSSIVLLGEATHGTHEFYHHRARITKRLIEEKGFGAVAAEADWPDAYQVNRFVRGEGFFADAAEALSGFERFPSWMWRNEDVLDFVEWLREHNEQAYQIDQQVGFYGLDLYSLHESIDEVIGYLDRKDPAGAENARKLYSCIDRYGRDPQNYGLMVSAGMGESCRNEVIEQLAHLRAKEIEYLAAEGHSAADEFFFAEQNARVVKNAEQYYRQMFVSDVSSWNQRDEHMMETLVKLLAHLQTHHHSAKVVVWAHNSHIGDARATEMARRGEWNLGQLVRQSFPTQSKLIGFTTSNGTVTAASGWHLPPEQKEVKAALEGSYEHLFHQVDIPNFWLDLTRESPAQRSMMEPRLERAIGVVYLPESERRSHYFSATLPKQFDAVLHFDQTRATEPLERSASWEKDEAPETYPIGL